MYLGTDRYDEITILQGIYNDYAMKGQRLCAELSSRHDNIEERALKQLKEEYMRKTTALLDAINCMKQVQQFQSFLTEVNFTIKEEGWKPDNNDYDVIRLNKKVEERKKELDAELFGRKVTA